MECAGYPIQWRKQEKVSGVQGYGRLVGGPGAEAPGRRRIFENLQKYFLRKLPKMRIYFWENLFIKIEPSQITLFFYNNFFPVRGRG